MTLRIPITWVRHNQEPGCTRQPVGGTALGSCETVKRRQPGRRSAFSGVTLRAQTECGSTRCHPFQSRGSRGGRPRHDVVDLIGIDGLVLHQGFGHGVQLVTVVGQDLLGRVVAVDR